MKELIPKNKIIKIAIFLASLSVVLYAMALFYVTRETNKLKNFYQNSESESVKAEKFQMIKTLSESNKESIQILEDFFIKKDDEVKFIEKIESVARNTGIDFKIESINVKSDQPDPFKEDVDIKINVEGSWFNIISFVNKLEKMSFGVLVYNINLDSQKPGFWSGSVEFSVFREK